MLLSHYISELLVAGNFSWLIYSSEDNPDFLRVGFLWKQVEDRGKAIKGPKRIDLYHRSHREALQWGRRKLQVLVVKPGESTLDLLKVPRPVKSVLKGLNWLRGLVF
jgi:hypothetical protein